MGESVNGPSSGLMPSGLRSLRERLHRVNQTPNPFDKNPLSDATLLNVGLTFPSERRNAVVSLNVGASEAAIEHERLRDSFIGIMSFRRRSDPQTTNRLCSTCQKFDFSSLAKQLRKGDPWKAVIKIDLSRQLTRALRTPNHCNLCRLFATVRLDSLAAESLPWQKSQDVAVQEDFQLVALMFELGGYHHPCLIVVPRDYTIPLYQFGRRRITHRESEHFEKHVTENNLLAIIDSKADRGTETSGQTKSCCPSLKIGDRLDLKKLRSWLDDCVANHEKCKTRANIEAEVKHTILVIDCERKILVPAPPECAYAALSYVWGPQQAADHDVLDNAPQVIKDAMFVTLGIGVKYLWVDRVCLPLDGKQKHEQIQWMDMIYSGAVVTIVDAVGNDANYGLEGVGVRPRTEQRSTTSSDGTEIVSCLHDPVHLIRQSPWASRAWTLQEGILSRRCLIFTKEQAYFECWEGRRAELFDKIDLGFEFPLRLDPLRRTSAFSRNIELSHSHERNVLHQLLLYISDYTSRRLTYDSDSLNAILGILKAAQSSNFTHHYGIPLGLDDIGNDFINILGCWFHEEGPQVVRRRMAFPSWSYVGFAGAVQFRAPSLLHSRGCAVEDIMLESRDGNQVSLDNFHMLSEDDRALYTIVSFRANVFQAEKRDLDKSSPHRFTNAHFSSSTTNSTDLLYVHIKSCFTLSEQQYWLIVRPTYDGYVERVGVAETNHYPVDSITEKRMIKLR